MQRLRSAPNLLLATLWADWLTQGGLPASVQRGHGCGIVGEIPPDQALPEVWIEDASRRSEAEALLDALTASPSRHWHCRGCGELVEGPFESCWNCGAPMP